MFPPSYYNEGSEQILAAMQNQTLNTNIYDGTQKTIAAINDTNRLVTNEFGGIAKDIYDSTGKINSHTERHALGIREALDRGTLSNGTAIERTAAVTQSAIERVAGENRMTTVTADAASRQAAADSARDIMRAVDHNGTNNYAAIERTSGVTQSAIERVAGENRITTVTADAASRQAAADSARDIMRAVDHNGSTGFAATERVGYQLANAVERNGANAMSTTERVNNQLATSVERNGGNIMTAVEKVAGENRLTTTVTNAAGREAAAGQARDLAVAIERNGANAVNATNMTSSTLLGSLERNSGESRALILQTAGTTDTKLTDVRHSILSDVNRGTSDNIMNSNRGFNEILTSNTQNLNVISKAVTDSAWEQRSAVNAGFNQSMVEQLKQSNYLGSKGADHYASLLLENQKTSAHLASKSDFHYASGLLELQKANEFLGTKMDNQFATNLLENQKSKEYLSSKGDAHYASMLLEGQKNKSDLANQAATHFSINQLEQQKLKECLTLQLADAKYEALKSQQFLADKMCECCCEVKQKIDLVDRDRLRDNLTVASNDNNLLKVVELAQTFGGGFGYGYGGYGRGRGRSRSRSRGRRDDREERH
jgi:hypothetical protein